MANIQCGNCGGVHASVTEVRQCHISEPRPDAETGYDEPDLSPQTTPTQRVRSTVEVIPGAIPGPDALGRSLLIRPGQPVPEPWADCPILAVDTSGHLDAAVIDDLHVAWAERLRVVIELTGELPQPTIVSGLNVWQLDPSMELLADRLVFLLTANCIDRRSGESTWHALSTAVSLGGEVATDGGDVLLGDASSVWLDGGPIGTAELNDDARVIHLTQLEAGGAAALTPSAVWRHKSSTAELAADQLEAVDHSGGPARVIAPAGSGKTRVLTERARLLLDRRNYPAKSLTLVAFNKRAQLEMHERTTDLAGLQVRTLNALGLAILRGNAPFMKSLHVGRVDVITERDVRSILDGLLDLRRRANTDQLAAWLEALTAVRLGLRHPDEVEQSFGGDIDGLAETVVKYRNVLADRGLVDFDEQIVRSIEVLLADPEARQVAQRTCRMMLVDEFQDLTPAHMLLVRLLAAPAFDVFGVGDDDQTIYGFTGARPDWLIDYADWFPGATHHALEVNYRCPPAVVTGADTLLTHNLRRVDKTIRSSPERQGTEADLDVVKAADPVLSAVERIRDLLESGSLPSEVVVLTRVNAALAPIQVALRADRVPVEQAVNEVFLGRSGVRAVLAWLRLSTGGPPFAAADIDAAARRPSRGIAPRVVSWMGEQQNLKHLRRLATRIDKSGEKVDGFADDLEELIAAHEQGAHTVDLIEMIRDELGLAGSLDALDSSRRSVDRSSHGDDLAALIALARLQSDATAFEPWLHAHLTEPGDPNGVRLATVHRVKGREWPHVVVLGADAGSFPHRLADDTEEERRVFHVAITRASESAAVIATASTPSRFLAQLTERRDPNAAPEPNRAPRRAVQPARPARPATDDPLRDALKKWRIERAKEDGVPAYVVFNDKTLDDILSRRPSDLRTLGQCHGIGPAKLDRFGDELIGVMDATSS